MSRYSQDSRDRVREAVDMVALVSDRTELRRAGPDRWVGRCPFHDERTPSFGIDPFKKVYHCFGCQASGDVFTFVMETEGLDFSGALEALAQRVGIELEKEGEDPAAAERRRRRERLFALLGRAADYYARYLWEAREASNARAYLLGRGLSEETLREFRVGYAPSAWDRILVASRKAGFSEEELLVAGLVQRSHARPGRVFDRFRERIMFPSADARGRVLGFGARAMREHQRPKYLNTSDGEIYHKRSQLFGIHLARPAATRAGRVILVEGYTDVLALHQAGLRNAVGIMGTALTEEQVAELERVAKVLDLCLDADRAGQDAMLRASAVARGRKLELRVVPLPEGLDPAELIEREGAEALRSRVGTSVPFVAFRVEQILARAQVGSAEGRDRAAAELRPVLAEVPPSALREDLIRRSAARLDLSEARLAELLADGGSGGGDSAPAPRTAQADTLDMTERRERAFLVMCLALPAEGAEALASADLDGLFPDDRWRRAAHHLRTRVNTPLAELPPGDDELARTVADLVARAGRAGAVTRDHIEHERLKLELARLEREIRRARVERRADIPRLAQRKHAAQAAIHDVGSRLEKAI